MDILSLTRLNLSSEFPILKSLEKIVTPSLTYNPLKFLKITFILLMFLCFYPPFGFGSGWGIAHCKYSYPLGLRFAYCLDDKKTNGMVTVPCSSSFLLL